MQLENHVMLDFDISPVGTSRLGEVDFDNLGLARCFPITCSSWTTRTGRGNAEKFRVWTHDVLSCHDVLALRPGHL